MKRLIFLLLIISLSVTTLSMSGQAAALDENQENKLLENFIQFKQDVKENYVRIEEYGALKENLENRIASLENQILKRIENLDRRIDGIENELEWTRENVVELKDDLGENLFSLRNKIVELRENNEKIRSNVASLSSNFPDVRDRIDRIEDEQTELHNSVQTIQKDFSELQQRMNEAPEKIRENLKKYADGRISKIQHSLAENIGGLAFEVEKSQENLNRTDNRWYSHETMRRSKNVSGPP